MIQNVECCFTNHLFIIEWEGLEAVGGLLRVGQRAGASWVVYKESGNTLALCLCREGGVIINFGDFGLNCIMFLVE